MQVNDEPLQTGNTSFTLSSSKAITTYLKEEKGNSLHFEPFYDMLLVVKRSSNEIKFLMKI